MFTRLKKILSIFVLAVLLLPMVAEQLHAFEHQEDKHCTNAETHYCTPEHHCTLCDFVQFTSLVIDYSSPLNADLILSAHQSNFYQSVVVSKHNFVYSLRGPPSVS